MHYSIRLWQSQVSNQQWVTNWVNIFPQIYLDPDMLKTGTDLKSQRQTSTELREISYLTMQKICFFIWKMASLPKFEQMYSVAFY